MIAPRLIIGLISTILPGVAVAAPLVTPTQDVEIVYTVTGPSGQTFGQRMRWDARSWRQRLDLAGAPTATITDYRNHSMIVLDLAGHVARSSPVPAGSFVSPGQPANGEWRSLGAQAHLAGETCAWWESRDTEGQPARLCYTADGLLLQAMRGETPLLTAQKVQRIRQPDDIFAIPAGFSVENP